MSPATSRTVTALFRRGSKASAFSCLRLDLVSEPAERRGKAKRDHAFARTLAGCARNGGLSIGATPKRSYGAGDYRRFQIIKSA
jgi:hypothetical protein